MDYEPTPNTGKDQEASQTPKGEEQESQKSRYSLLDRARQHLARRAQAAKEARAIAENKSKKERPVKAKTVRSLVEPTNQAYDFIRNHEIENPTANQNTPDINQPEPYSLRQDVTHAVKNKIASSTFFNPDRSNLTTPDLGKHIAQRNQTPTWENHILDKKDIPSPLVQIKNLAGKIFPFGKITEFRKNLFSRKDQTPPAGTKSTEPTPTAPPSSQQSAT